MKDKLYNMIVEKENELYRANPYMYNSERIETVANHLIDSGLVIVLPCKVGDYVYKINTKDLRSYLRGESSAFEIYKGIFTHGDIPQFGNLVFLTKEEAEAKLNALKGETNETE